jgi:hypothetical protein
MKCKKTGTRALSASILVRWLLVASLASGAHIPQALAQAPQWWTTRGVLIAAPASDYAPANQGQAKWMAQMAAQELHEKLPPGDESAIQALLDSFTQSGNYLPLNVGQLKNLVKPFYDRINSVAGNHPCVLVVLPANMPGQYPWTDTTSDDADYSPVNIGQLKYVFSFDFTWVAPQLQASCRPNRIVLNWDVCANEVQHAASFVIGRSVIRGGPYTDLSTVTSGQQYVDAAVVGGLTYYYVMRMHMDDGTDVYSSEAAANTCQTPPRGPTDVAFIIDNTGSMGSSLNAVKSGIASVLQDIITASGTDFRLALVTPDTDQVDVRVNFSQNNSVSFWSGLSRLFASGGGNTPESTDQCLNTVVNALPDDAHGRTDAEGCKSPFSPLQINSFAPAFRANANKIVVLITDASPGGFCDSTRPPQIPHQYAVEAALQGIQINAILVNDGAADFDTAYPFMQDYAQATCGWFCVVPPNVVAVKDAMLRMIYASGSCPPPPIKPPVANPQALTVNAGVPQNITLTGSDPNGLALSYVLLSSPAHGTLTGNSPNLVYSPNPPNYTGPDSFDFKVNNGVLDSLPATVSINVISGPPSIIGQPTDQTVLVGAQASFTVTATGSIPLSYQWFDASGTMLVDGNTTSGGATISGALTSTLTLTGVQAGDSGNNYYVTVSNPAGSVDSSRANLFAVNPVPAVILSQPRPQVVKAGGNATFTVSIAPSAPPTTFQWYKNGNTVNGQNSSLALQNVALADDGSMYWVVVHNPYGDTESEHVRLTVLPPTIAGADIYQFAQGSQNNLLKVLLNDSDADNYPLTITSYASPTPTPHGTVQRTGDSQALLYTPDPTFNGVEVFTYTIDNGHGRTATGKVIASVGDNSLDSDDDGIPDAFEVAVFGTDPNNPDTDGNGIADGDEDPFDDGMTIAEKLQMGLDPFMPLDWSDSGTGLPRWASYLIQKNSGISNPGPSDDSDGDGVDNYTEAALMTDPSRPDNVYSYSLFNNLPDSQRAFTIDPITVQRSGVPASTDDLNYDSFGTLGTYVHLDVMRDQDAYGNPLPGSDSIFFTGAFQAPDALYIDRLEDENGQQPAEGLIPTRELVIIPTHLLERVWEEAKVSELIDQLDRSALVVIRQRAMARITIIMRRLQLSVDLQNMTTGARLRLRYALSRIHTEIVVFQKTSARIAQMDGSSWWRRAGVWLKYAGRAATVVSAAYHTHEVYEAAETYVHDCFRRCDDNGESALFLALAMCDLASDANKYAQLAQLDLIYWDALARFDGYGTSCQ